MALDGVTTALEMEGGVPDIRRFLAALWDKTLPPAQAADKAGAPAAWSSLGRQAIYPKA